MSEHFPGRANCACAVCRPHLAGEEQDVDRNQPSPVLPVCSAVGTTQDAPRADRSFPPKRAEPPAHYLKKREKWDGYVGMDADEGQTNNFRRFDNNIRGRD